MMRPLLLPALAAAGLIGGCVAIPKDAGFADVQTAVADRTGQHATWNRLTRSDADVAAAVRGLLARGLDADRAVQVALLNNRRLQATYEDLGVAQADVVQAGLLKNPVFDGDFKVDTHGGGTHVELAVVENFLDVFFIPLRRRVAEDGFETAKTRVTAAVVDLAGRTRAAYYAQVAGQQSLALRRTATAAAAAVFDFSTSLYAAGNVSDYAYASDQVVFEQSKLDLARAEADASDDRERLTVLLGVWGNDTAWTTPAALPDLPATEADTADVESRAVAASLDLGVAKIQVDSSARALGLRRSLGLLPEVELGVAAERETAGGWGVGPAFALPVPLFDQGQGATAGARAELERARQSYYATAVEVRSAARSARNRLLAARAAADYTRRVIVPLREKITTQAQLFYNGMYVGAPQLFGAKQAEVEARIAAVDALRDYWLARTAFDRVMAGSGSRGSTAEDGRCP